MNTFKMILYWIKRFEIVVSTILIVIIALITILQVIMRYLVKMPLTWPLELSTLLLVYLTFFTADIVYKGKEHVVVDFFFNKFSKKHQVIVTILINLLTCIFFVVMFFIALEVLKVQSSFNIATVLPLNKSYWSLPVPIAFCSMFLTTAYELINEIMQLVSPKISSFKNRKERIS